MASRAVLGLGVRPLAVGAAAAAAARHAHPQNGGRDPTSPTQAQRELAMEEHDDFMHVFEGPVQHHEVTAALGDLSSLGGGSSTTLVAAHRAVPLAQHPPRALIEELEAAESEASSVGSSANHLLASVDSMRPAFLGPAALGMEPPAPAEETALDLLSTTITNVLNDEAVMSAIQARMLVDPAFVQFVQHVQPGQPGLPPAAYPLFEDVSSEYGDAGTASPRGIATGNPVVDLLQFIQQGVSVAAIKMGEGFCQMGNFLRGVGENLSRALAGMESNMAGGGAAPHPRSFQLVVVKVAAAVAVLVLTRRVALARMAAAVV